MMTINQIKNQIVVVENLLKYAIADKNLNLMLQYQLALTCLKDCLIEQYEKNI